ncbi:hypothetical protein M911_12115 [Ectothiorhodospira haloalkaliphila]|uniref:Uncharacterized protein n=1 Tax=Ectothiorhodospira haloalkaliphila TaxID=421628 RepID=W8KLT0_9GAMM|nr:hypothetical protein M911_12115 [Ectothiorhodospira haloalkaliphila]
MPANLLGKSSLAQLLPQGRPIRQLPRNIEAETVTPGRGTPCLNKLREPAVHTHEAERHQTYTFLQASLTFAGIKAAFRRHGQWQVKAWHERKTRPDLIRHRRVMGDHSQRGIQCLFKKWKVRGKIIRRGVPTQQILCRDVSFLTIPLSHALQILNHLFGLRRTISKVQEVCI